ncbi:D(1)-like dopamine receptor [Palaemon carinicauda]|uniref:D(1)-like dopamine receptor n=1 Tax=Palaemon carinicauda TaxID=392227 RepID=UPI0035B591AE
MEETSWQPTLSSVSPDTERIEGIVTTATADSLLPFSICLFITCTMALIANAFMIASIIKSRTLRRKRSSHFTVSFLLSSASTAVSCMNIVGLSWIDDANEEHEKISSFVWTVLFGLLWNFGIAHYFTSCALALTRLMAMAWPVKYQKLMSTKISNFLVGLPWFFSVFVCLPAFYGVLGKPDSKMYEYTPGQKRSDKIWAMAYMATSVGGPVMIACVSYIVMFIMATGSQCEDNSQGRNSGHRISQWQSGITRALLANLIIQLSCNIPHAVCHAVDGLNKNPVFKATVHVICSVQYILDPLMFFIVAQEYRKAGLEFLKFVFPRGHRSVPTSSDSCGTSNRLKTFVEQNTCDL